MVGMLVRDEDGLNGRRVDADGLETRKNFGSADPRIDQHARRVTADIETVAFRT